MSAVPNVALSGKTHYGQMESIIIMVNMAASMAVAVDKSLKKKFLPYLVLKHLRLPKSGVLFYVPSDRATLFDLGKLLCPHLFQNLSETRWVGWRYTMIDEVTTYSPSATVNFLHKILFWSSSNLFWPVFQYRWSLRDNALSFVATVYPVLDLNLFKRQFVSYLLPRQPCFTQPDNLRLR